MTESHEGVLAGMRAVILQNRDVNLAFQKGFFFSKNFKKVTKQEFIEFKKWRRCRPRISERFFFKKIKKVTKQEFIEFTKWRRCRPRISERVFSKNLKK